jgi:predicted enzyme related to lactoylglutathione lyase
MMLNYKGNGTQSWSLSKFKHPIHLERFERERDHLYVECQIDDLGWWALKSSRKDQLEAKTLTEGGIRRGETQSRLVQIPSGLNRTLVLKSPLQKENKHMNKHPIVHIEISAKDRVAASKFYTDLFGWKVEQMPEMNYATFEAEGGPGGGFNPVTKENPAGTVTVYVHTDDIPATLAKITALGGKVLVPETEIPTVGWFAYVSDPTGNHGTIQRNTKVG